MVKRIQGVIKNYDRQRTFFTGYRNVWNMGRAGRIKRSQRLTGINRPST